MCFRGLTMVWKYTVSTGLPNRAGALKEMSLQLFYLFVFHTESFFTFLQSLSFKPIVWYFWREGKKLLLFLFI